MGSQFDRTWHGLVVALHAQNWIRRHVPVASTDLPLMRSLAEAPGRLPSRRSCRTSSNAAFLVTRVGCSPLPHAAQDCIESPHRSSVPDRRRGAGRSWAWARPVRHSRYAWHRGPLQLATLAHLQGKTAVTAATFGYPWGHQLGGLRVDATAVAVGASLIAGPSTLLLRLLSAGCRGGPHGGQLLATPSDVRSRDLVQGGNQEPTHADRGCCGHFRWQP